MSRMKENHLFGQCLNAQMRLLARRQAVIKFIYRTLGSVKNMIQKLH